MNDRQTQLLDFIVRHYVRTAEPVGSAVVSARSGLDISPATVRNEMQALEESGYLYQPHTSAGRIPTDKAYRRFVNGILKQEDYGIEPKAKHKVDEAIRAGGDDPHEINKNIANALTDLSSHVVITNIDEMDDFYKTGLSGLSGFPEFRHLDRIFELTDFFDRFDALFASMERQVMRELEDGAGIQIYIGSENPFRNIRGETTIWTRYPMPDGYTGSLTVIGPTRMDYKRNLGLVSYTTELMRRFFNNE